MSDLKLDLIEKEMRVLALKYDECIFHQIKQQFFNNPSTNITDLNLEPCNEIKSLLDAKKLEHKII
jgi:hypothetical protein